MGAGVTVGVAVGMGVFVGSGLAVAVAEASASVSQSCRRPPAVISSTLNVIRNQNLLHNFSLFSLSQSRAIISLRG